MGVNRVHVPAPVLAILHETSASLGSAELDQLMAAAVWSFDDLDDELKHYLVQDFWSGGANAWEEKKQKKTLKERIHELASRLCVKICACVARSSPGPALFQDSK